jgi:uncharacterized membrane protein
MEVKTSKENTKEIVHNLWTEYHNIADIMTAIRSVERTQKKQTDSEKK